MSVQTLKREKLLKESYHTRWVQRHNTFEDFLDLDKWIKDVLNASYM